MEKKSHGVSDTILFDFGEASKLNQQIRYMVRKAEDIIDLGIKCNKPDLEVLLKNNFDVKEDFQTIESRIIRQIEEAKMKDPKINLDLYF